MSKAVVLFSGGQDSTTCLYWAKQQFASVTALSFDYNQRHRLELESAKQIAALAGVDHEIINMGSIFAGLSPLTDHSRKVEEYDSAQTLPGGLEQTFVPGRNILFLSVAANRAYVIGGSDIVIGVSQEDYGGYPDCRKEFVTSMQQTLSAGLGKEVRIHTPLLNLSKKQTVELALDLNGCMDALAHSTTCYNGAFPPCGTCHSCLLRARGFDESGHKDPLLHRCKNSMEARAPNVR